MSPGPPDSLSLHSLSLPGEGFLLSLRFLIHSLTVSHRHRLQSLLLRYYFYIALLTAHSMSHGGRPGPENAESSGGSLHFTSESGVTRTLGSTEPCRDESNSQDPSNVQTGQGTFAPSEDGHIHILKALEEVMESFRGGKTLKTEAISSVLCVVREDSDVSLTQPQRESDFNSYLTEILSIQSGRDESGGPESSGPRPGESQPLSNSPASSPSTCKTRPPSGSESDDNEDKPSKKQRLLESDMPWYEGTGDLPVSHSNPSCEETCRLLRAYNRDITKAKFYVKIAPNSLTGILSSQWEQIFKGEAVDLNQVFASLHHIIPDEERTGCLGDTEISFGISEPRKRILSAAEWSTAWRRASKAIGFAFPHQRDKLLEYGDYIESEFAAKVSSSHHKLLLYDVALRNEVAAGQHCLLTDHSKFSRLYSAIVLPDGVENHSDKIPGKKLSKSNSGSDKPEICNKFNAGTCKNSNADCKYRHLCKGCHKPGHGKNDCSHEIK